MSPARMPPTEGGGGRALTLLFSFRYFALGLLYHYNNQDAAAVQVSSKALQYCFKINTLYLSAALKNRKVIETTFA